MYHNARTKDNLCASRSCAVRNSASGQNRESLLNNGVTSYAAADYFNPLVLAAQTRHTLAFTSISSFFTYNTFSSIIIRSSVQVSLSLTHTHTHTLSLFLSPPLNISLTAPLVLWSTLGKPLRSFMSVYNII